MWHVGICLILFPAPQNYLRVGSSKLMISRTPVDALLPCTSGRFRSLYIFWIHLEWKGL